jgi:succinoglycan biosynthesis protein ExoA
VQSSDPSAGVTTSLVTVVVPARNEEHFIAGCLGSILAQDHTDIEVIVVDGASTDRTREIVAAISARDPRVRLIGNPQRIIPVSLNLALAAAQGAWLVRVDAHATVPPDYVSKALAHLRSGRWGAVGGRKDGVGKTAAGRAVAAVMASPFGVGNSTYHHGTEETLVEHVPFGAYPTAVARELGGWDENLLVNQDFEFDWRVRESGRKILFDPKLRIDWHCRQSVADLFRQYRRYGKGKTKVAALHPRSLRLRHLAAPALVLWLAGCAALGARRPRAAIAGVAPYVAGLGIATVATAQPLDREARRFVAPAFLAMHIGWGLGFLEGALELARSAKRGA